MSDKHRRIPRTIWLDETVKVLVRLETPKMMEALQGEKGCAGLWDVKNYTIHIDRTISWKRKWKAFRHEMKHALTDVHDYVEGGI